MSPFICEKVQNENPSYGQNFKLFTLYCKERAEIQSISQKLAGWSDIWNEQT